MKKLPQQRCLVALLCAMGLGSWANSSFADVQYKFSGFGTLGAAVTNNDDTGFRTSVDQFKGATKKPSLDADSKLAVQGSAIISDTFTVTTQVLGTKRGTDDFDVGFEWLYAQYTGVTGLDLKAGRVVLPAFLVSDSRLVGYASPWLRVSPLVYAMMPLSHVDGGQVTYRHAIGPAVASVQLTRGSGTGLASNTQPLGGPFYAFGTSENTTDHIVGLNGSLEWQDWTFRASQVTGNTTLDFTIPLPAGLGGGVATRQLIFKDKFQELGLQYDDGKFVVMAEHVKRTTKDDKVQDAKSWYVAAAYRFGSVAPYVMVSQYKESYTFGGGTVPPKTKGLALGARYDFANNLALKAEWAQYKNNSTYIFTDAASPAVVDKKINVMSVALDFIF